MSTAVLQLPNSYVNIENDEMEYVDGGAVHDESYYARSGSKFLAAQAAYYITMVTGFTSVIALGYVTAGLAAVIGAVGTGYSGFLAREYTKAYNACEALRADHGDELVVNIRTITLSGAITSVAVSIA